MFFDVGYCVDLDLVPRQLFFGNVGDTMPFGR